MDKSAEDWVSSYPSHEPVADCLIENPNSKLCCVPEETLPNISKNKFSREDLESCAEGILFGKGNAQLPTPPLLMLDRIMDIHNSGGEFNRGYAIAELDLHVNDWFLSHHFKGDPIMPGCFMFESLWQLTGFHLAWSGNKGRGRVLDSGRARFLGSITGNCCIEISIHVRKQIMEPFPIYIANGEIKVDGETKCVANSFKVGLF